MHLPSWVTKSVIVLTIAAFCGMTSGCAGILGETQPRGATVAIKPSAEAVAPQIIVEAEPAKPLVKEVLRKGQAAPGDGIWYDKESAKVILGDLAEYRILKTKVQIQEQVIGAYGQQVQLLREANDLQAQANQDLRAEIESQRKWSTIKNWASVVGIVGGVIAGIFLAK